MRRIILIAGLPGSGKTHLAQRVTEKMSGVLVDDPQSLTQLPDIFSVLVIADPFLVYKRDQDQAEAYLYNKYQDCHWIEWVFFENNPEQCLKNAISRQKITGEARGVRAFINFATQHYHIRPHSIVCKVYQPKKSNDTQD